MDRPLQEVQPWLVDPARDLEKNEYDVDPVRNVLPDWMFRPAKGKSIEYRKDEKCKVEKALERAVWGD